MPTLAQISIIVHVTAGMLTLIAGPIAIFANRRHIRLHKIVGKIFFYAMLVVCFSAVSVFLRRPNEVFLQFLLGIAILVFAGVLRAVRAFVIMKTGKIGNIDVFYSILLGLNALWMLGMSTWHFIQGTMIAFPILFLVFGLGAAGDVSKNIKMFSKPENFDKIAWLKLHVSSMLSAFTASTTAFTVNSADFLPWYLQWFGPTLLLLPLQIYWGKQLSPKAKNIKSLT
jgi:hypothetical protein